jgi:hypothetical protein
MQRIEFPQTHCWAAIARCEITPPVGIYHRMWGAARHDRATGVHRPLLATLLWIEPRVGDPARAVITVALDHCILDQCDIELIQQSVARAAEVRTDQVGIVLSHTHAAGLMSRTRADQPGGDLIAPYLDSVAAAVGQLAQHAAANLQPATIVYGTGCCRLAAHRDYWDPDRQQFVCGFHPEGPADDTLLVAKILGDDRTVLGTLVNYACHPTTLAWDNTQISPDYVGAMREIVETHVGGLCLFVQGASGDLGPRDGYVGDAAIADMNGRELGFAALAALEQLPPPRLSYVYQGAVVSGTLIGHWEYEPAGGAMLEQQERWQVEVHSVGLPYRTDLPTIDETEQQRRQWLADEQAARQAGDERQATDCRARVEQMTRQLWRLEALPLGKCFPLPVTVARLGTSLWVWVPGEHYQHLQLTLRQRFPQLPVIVATLANGWQPGYVPPAATYGYGIYQESIAVTGPGSAEILIEELTRCLRRIAVE